MRYLVNKIATILIGEKYAYLDPNYLKSFDIKLPMDFDSDSIKYTIKVLQKYDYHIRLMTWEKYLYDLSYRSDLIIVAQWTLIRTKWDKSSLINFRKRVNASINSGSNFLLMHAFWPELSFFRDSRYLFL